MPLAAKYLPVFILFAFAVAIPIIMLAIAGVTGPRQPSERKMTPFECGIDAVGTTGDARHRFSVKFFLVALLFIIFDIEAVFVFPWSVLFRELGIFGFVEMGIFLGLLLLGLFYVWKKGALEWE